MDNRSRARWLGLPAIAAVAMLVLSGCTTGTTSEGEASNNNEAAKIDTVRSTLLTDPGTFDPALATASDDFSAADLLFGTVLKRSNDGVTGSLASDYVAEPNKVELTIKENQVCADGTPITATVVANSLARLADPETGSTIRSLIFGPGETTVSANEDDNKVTIEISEAYSDLLYGLTLPSSGIVCPAGMEDLDGLAAGTVEGAFSGAYTLSEATPGVEYVWTLRDDYDAWPEYDEPLDGVPVKNIVLTPGASDSVANRLATGDLDIAGIAHEELERFEGDDYTIQNRYSGDYFIIFNQSESSPFTDQNLRKAVAQAVNQQGFIEATNPLGHTTTSVGDVSVPCYLEDPSLLQEYNTDAASQLLAGLKIKLVGSNIVGTNGAGVEYLAESLRAVGAEVDLTNTDNSTWVSTVLGPDTESWDMTLWASINTAGTLINSLGRVIGSGLEDGGRNIMRIEKPETTEPYKTALATTEPEAMCAAYFEAQEQALENIDFVPLGTNASAVVSAEGFDLNIIGGRSSYTNLRVAE